MSTYIKFADNVPVEVELTYENPIENINSYGKKQYGYGIKELISGENIFSATEKLHEKIKAANFSMGDKFIIEKVVDPNVNKGFAFFKVTPSDVAVTGGNATPSPKHQHTQTNPSEPNDATKLNILWNYYQSITSDKGHLPGDEDIPF